MKTKLGKRVVYVVYIKGENYGRVHKNLKSVANIPEYGMSIHSLYKHDFTEAPYFKDNYKIQEQLLF